MMIRLRPVSCASILAMVKDPKSKKEQRNSSPRTSNTHLLSQITARQSGPTCHVSTNQPLSNKPTTISRSFFHPTR